MFAQDLLKYINIQKDVYGNELEIEIKVLLDPRIKTPDFIKVDDNYLTKIKKLLNDISNYSGEISTEQTINFIHTYPRITDGMFIKQLYFNNGIQNKDMKKYYIKKALIEPVYITSDISPSYKFSVNIETDQEKDIEKFDISRFRHRYSIKFSKPELINWKLDITLIKETRDSSIDKLKELKKLMFEKQDINWNIADRIEVELEFIGNYITVDDINNLNILWKSIQNERTYLDCICQMAQILKPHQIDKFKSGYFGIKHLGTSPIDLTKQEYDKILPNIDNYILTEKIDGCRTMLILYPSQGVCYIINKSYKCVSIPITSDELIILDTEEYYHNEISYYYVFDVIWYNKNVSNLPYYNDHECRQMYLNKSIGIYKQLKQKKYVYLTKTDYKKQIEKFYKTISNLPYNTDGFIFISKNLNYNKTINLKWKPPKYLSIDFVAKKCPKSLLGIHPYIVKENMVLYLLFVGIKQCELQKAGLKKIKNYDKIFNKVSPNDLYIPIQFSPSSNPTAYLFWSDNHNLDNNIVELNRMNDTWKLLKIRDDRKIDMERKTYYGNYFKYAEIIWMNFHDPITIHDLTSQSKSYFKEHDNNRYTYIRKFNNFVKNSVIKLYANDINWVIDLASGKGQDLQKYINCNIKNILMTDNDQSALMEIVNRKFQYIYDTKITNNANVFIRHINLLDPYEHNINMLTAFNIPINGVPLIVCNFALHYITRNKNSIRNFVNLVNKLLRVGGIFIYTAFDGKKIFDLLINNDWNIINNNEILYSIKKKYDNSEFTGIDQKIDVLLPFSNGSYYEEYLINSKLLNSELAKKKINLVNSNSFCVYFDKFKQEKPQFYNKLSDDDKKFISLYGFNIYHKTNK